jgi:hypothetical protein
MAARRVRENSSRPAGALEPVGTRVDKTVMLDLQAMPTGAIGLADDHGRPVGT